MDTSAMAAAIDDEIARLKKVRELLGGAAPVFASKRRGLSPEARRRISEAQKRRWAAAKRAAK